MKAAIVQSAGAPPVYGDIDAPTATGTKVVVNVTAAALSSLTKMRASGTHYSSTSAFPFVPGFDGVGTVAGSGERVYFAFPDAAYGALGQQALVDRASLRSIPDDLDDVTAASVANPGMSAWASMVHRAHIAKGETVLINGATGTAGKLAIQLAKELGAGKVIATARNAQQLEELKAVGADVTIAFNLTDGEAEFKKAVAAEFKQNGCKGIDIIIDYLYGPSTAAILASIPGNLADGHRVRYVNVGTAAGVPEIPISAALLRSSALELMGSGLNSVTEATLLDSIAEVFKVAARLKLDVDATSVPLKDISQAWAQKGAKPRLVVVMQ